jgi:hypothetical protein
MPLTWRRLAPLVAVVAFASATDSSNASAGIADVRALSYYPAHGGWTLMWTRFRPGEIDRDMGRIASLRANTVRIVVPASLFGYPEPTPDAMAKLDRVVALAARHRLRVQLTLFDWWHDYSDLDGSKRWATGILSRYRGDPRLALVELKNELQPQDATAVAWARQLLPHVRREVGVPVGISVAGLDVPRDLALLKEGLARSQPDFYSAHFYWDPGFAYEDLSRAKQAVAPIPLIVGETGYSTYLGYPIVSGLPRTGSAREAAQAYYLRSLALTARRLRLPPIQPWILSDFTRAAIPRDDPGVFGNPREYLFGLFRVSGAPKPAAGTLRSIFAGRYSYGFNNGFEDGVRDEGGRSFPALWRTRVAPRARFTRDVGVSHRGRASARISATRARTGPDAAFMISPPDPGVRAGDRSTATAYARATEHCGRIVISIAWLARSGSALATRRSRPVRCGGSDWQRLMVTGLAPEGAAYVRIQLRAARIAGSVWFDDVAYACGRGRGRC